MSKIMTTLFCYSFYILHPLYYASYISNGIDIVLNGTFNLLARLLARFY